jgi:quercetin dioxygenase-like cupin family protein
MNYLETITADTDLTTPIHAGPAVGSVFNLFHEIDELCGSAQYTTGGHAARTLVRLPTFRVVLFVLRRHTEFKQHHTAQPIMLQMLTGRIRITLPARWIEQAAGEMLVMQPGLTHDITAMFDSAFLLSMPWSDRPKV